MCAFVHSAILMSRARIRVIEPPRYSAHRHMQSSVQHHLNVAVQLSAMDHVFAKSSPSVRVIMCVVHTLAPLSFVEFLFIFDFLLRGRDDSKSSYCDNQIRKITFESTILRNNGMDFGKAIATCMGKYAVFSGRATRSEFWWFYLFAVTDALGRNPC